MLIFISLPLFSKAQQTTASLSGLVSDSEGGRLPAASVIMLDTIGVGVTCNENGTYVLPKIRPGTYRFVAAMVGYAKQTKEVTLEPGQSIVLNFVLAQGAETLDEVVVTSEKTEVQKVREQSYTVTSIDVTPLQNLNLDVNTLLNRSTGIRIRQEGGLGSDFSFSLNGFSGNQVRFFIDGISADVLGSSMRFNNIPVNIVERIEVYKGVVPVHLGADALGGAVNIVTSDNAKDFLDVSYGYGSFNTHQAAIASRVTFNKHVVLNTSGFFNYSDNDYFVDAPVVESNGTIGSYKPFRLFNEGYISGSAMAEGGVINTKWADRFLVGLVVAANKKDRQRGRAMVLNPAGEVYTRDHNITPTLKYQKKNFGVKNLSLSASAVYSYMQAMNVDTSSHIYNWDGSYKRREFGTTSGELSWYKTKFRFNDHAVFNTVTLQYTAGKHHTFTVNNTYSYFRRKGSDPVASEYDPNVAFSDPSTLVKNTTGFSYKLALFDDRLNTTAFIKLFDMNAEVQKIDEDTDETVNVHRKSLEHGAGLATSFFMTEHLQLKASYENTARLPENDEMFGDGLLLQPNVGLEPERSHNVNVGVLYGKRSSAGHVLNMEGGFLYRLPRNMIRAQAIGVMAQYQNLSKARVLGGEASVRYSYKRRVNVELNATYQDMRNNSKAIDSYDDPLYLDRIPNEPFLFGNAIFGLTTSEIGESNLQLSVNWSTMYVEAFYLKWPSQGGRKADIPQQVSHDAAISLSAVSGRYNISLSCANITDNDLYDNYKVQKPGRSFNIKLRYYIERFKD